MTDNDSSPRKTRSRSRLVPTDPGDSQTKALLDPILLFPQNDPLSIPTVPVMKATSMEPIFDLPMPTEKRPRHKMTGYQLERLEELYRASTHPSRDAKEALAKEVGMTFKSVLIWFQNRRQDRPRKRKATAPASVARERVKIEKSSPKPKVSQASARPAATHGQTTETSGSLYAATRTITFSEVAATAARLGLDRSMHEDFPTAAADLGNSHQTHTFSCRPPPVGRSPVSSSETLGSDERDQSCYLRKTSFATDVSSPTTSTLPTAVTASPAPSSATLPAPQLFTNTRNLPADTSATLHKHKLDLEWACANSAARRDHGIFAYQDEDDSADDDDSDLEAEGGFAHQGARPHRRKSGRRVRVAVPREYHALFSPDVVQGASLLLTFKHSED